MKQFDVFENPIARARRAYPFVVVLNADLATTGRERIVAPLAPRARIAGTAGRLTPHVRIAATEHVVLVPNLAAIPAAELREVRAELGKYRAELGAAIDYLFFGV